MAEIFSKEISKIKMKILTKHGFENLTWYSPIKQNRWNNTRIIQGMIRRFKKNPAATITNKLQFYENGVLIYQEAIK